MARKAARRLTEQKMSSISASEIIVGLTKRFGVFFVNCGEDAGNLTRLRGINVSIL